MKLIAKKGTAFEQTLKKMYEKITDGRFTARSMVGDIVGVMPMDTYIIFHWGIISKLVPEFVFDEKDSKRINPKYLRKMKGTKDVWVPALRYKEGNQLDNIFREFAKKYEVTDEPLHKYGIHMVDIANGRSYAIRVCYEKTNDRYLLKCSDSIPKAFNKDKLAREQFDVEY